MYKMNRVFTGFLLVALMFSGCDNQNNISHEKKTECDKLKLVPLIDELKLAPVVNDGGWKVIASSHEDDFISAMAVDGNLSTRWSSKFKDNQWWMVDFGSLQRVGKVTLNWETAYPKSYRILVSKDTDAWEEVYSTESSQGGTETIRFSPCNARYVKIECLKRATKWGNSLFEVEFNAPDPIKVDAKASSGTDAYDPRCAVDGNFKTRWSSNFTDDEWWIGEFEKPVELGGMKILWETAFGEKYNIQVSMDGENWNKVYEVTDGDGKTDIIFFKPVKSKFIKIDGIQRGTGWGYSIFEIDFFLKGKMPLVSASSSEGLLTPDLIFDGDRETFWHSGKDGKESVMIKLPGSFFLGGMELTWDTDYACSYSIDLSNDGKDWKTVFKQDEGNGKKDWVFFNSENASFVRINCKSSNSGNGYALSEIEFKSGEERATPVKSYQALAKDLPEGMFPMWLRRKQEFWTVTGLIDEVRDSIIGETGTFEPKA
ncbi:MAG: discoidin domain-containing protein, partial [Candidatus Auribacterota bacterium]|nr:discoidin domain-containing protein [Candidatus Auribacterota bacterium]